MKKKKMSFYRLMLRSVYIQFVSVPMHTIFFIFVVFMEATALIGGIISTQRLFDSITGAAAGKVGVMECTISLLIMIGVTIVQHIMNGLKFYQWDVLSGKMEGILKAKVYYKLEKILPEKYEDVIFIENLDKAKAGIKPLISTNLILLNLIFYDVLYFSSVGKYLYSQKPVLILTLMLAFIPALLSQVIHVKIYSKLEDQVTPVRREVKYYERTICDREFFKETRTLGAFRYFYEHFESSLKLLSCKEWKAHRDAALLDLLLNLVTYVGMGTSTYILFVATMNREISVGSFGAIFAALGQIFDIMQWLIKWEINDITENVGKIFNVLHFLELHEYGGEEVPDFFNGIVAEDISFSYPNEEKNAVSNVSLKINRGETIAIVGENGSGKSTLVRLLTGIYRPLEGKVTIGGLDTSHAALSYLFSNTSGVFQKYQRYKMTLADNVSISNTYDEPFNNGIEMALKKAHIRFDNKDVNLLTMLSPEFGGIDLSGGEWQRIAMARGFYRNHDFIVLDEPTASIDPIEEDLLYRQFKNIVEDKSAVIVTHRLGSNKMVDRIIVMDKGKIVDIGTHDELISRSGKYASMWIAQSQWYKRTGG